MAYCFDTSALMECWTRYYPVDVFPGLWDRFDQLARDGVMLAPDEVLRELAKKQDELYGWAKARPAIFLELDDEIQDATREILAAHPLLAKEFAQRSHADPFVIAVGRVRGVPVVTQESVGSHRRPTIPYVCRDFGIRCIGVVEFIREQGWAFR